jgi:hypothetical protein
MRMEKKGRSRLREINDDEFDLRGMDLNRWRSRVLDRGEWASILREAMAKLKGL